MTKGLIDQLRQGINRSDSDALWMSRAADEIERLQANLHRAHLDCVKRTNECGQHKADNERLRAAAEPILEQAQTVEHGAAYVFVSSDSIDALRLALYSREKP